MKSLSDDKTNLLIDGEHAMMEGEPKRWVLYNPTLSPYLIKIYSSPEVKTISHVYEN